MLIDTGAAGDPADARDVFADSRTAERFFAGLGWTTLPTDEGRKRPRIAYADRRNAGTVTTPEEARAWWGISPEFGISLALGGAAGPLVVDTDSAAALAALVDRLGGEPVTWTADSGSADTARRHYYFAAEPGLPAAASITPWQDELEFRGTGGLITAPPSGHPGGGRYRWRTGRSPLDVPLAPLPGPIADEFRRHAEHKAAGAGRPAGARPATAVPPTAMTTAHRLRVEYLPGVGFNTTRFLRGEFSEGPQWNRRLFNAACDLEANGYADAWGEAALLLGAAPWDSDEEQKTLATIASAFSQPRAPAVDRPPLAVRLKGRAAR